MAVDSNTANKGYILQGNGNNSGTWGDKLNDEMITYVDYNLGGLKNQGLTNANVTLSPTDSRNVIYRLTGVLSANVIVYLDAAVSNGFLIVENLTSGAFTVSIGNTTPLTATATVLQGTRALLISDNTNGVRIVSQTGVTTFNAGSTGFTPISATYGDVTLGGILNVANGGTGLATLTSNNVILGNGTSAPNFVAPGTSGNVLVSNGTTWTSGGTATLSTISGVTTIKSGSASTPPTIQDSGGVQIGTFCRAWANFNGTLSGTITPRANFNIPTVSKINTARYRANFSTTMPDVNYAALITILSGGGYSDASLTGACIISLQTNYVDFFTGDTSNNSFNEVSTICIAVFR